MAMWKQLAMGFALNLIASAIVDKLAGRNPALVLFALGILIIAIVAIFGRKTTGAGASPAEPVRSNSSTNNADSFKQSLENVGNPHVETHVHFPLPPPSASTQTDPLREETNPNIQFVRTRNIRVTQGDAHGRILVEAVREIDSHNPQAAVACFRNTPLES